YSTNKGVLIVTPMQGLNFPAAEYIEIQAFERSVEAGKSKNIILNMENLTDVDYTVIQSLKTLLCDCSYHGMKLVLANGQ
ncbi:sodium-independent sulfate anion transporter, partial [Biomphalaria glabrata]